MKYLGNKPRIKNVAKSGFFVVLNAFELTGNLLYAVVTIALAELAI